MEHFTDFGAYFKQFGWLGTEEQLAQTVNWLEAQDVSCPKDLAGAGDILAFLGIDQLCPVAVGCLQQAVKARLQWPFISCALVYAIVRCRSKPSYGSLAPRDEQI